MYETLYCVSVASVLREPVTPWLLLSIAVAIALYVGRRFVARMVARFSVLRFGTRDLESTVSAYVRFWSIGIVLLAGSAILHLLLDARTLSAALADGRLRFVQGRVKRHTFAARALETFSIQDVIFTIDAYRLAVGFHEPGLIRDGMPLRVWFLDSPKRIAKVQVWHDVASR